MDEKFKLDLPYGHFGRAEYFPEDGAWHFGRELDHRDTLRPLGITKVIDPGTSNEEIAAQPNNHQPPSRRHAEQVKRLAKDHPELYSATKLLPPLLRVSEAVQHAVRDHEPTRGALLAFAELRSASRHKNIPVAAVVSGQTGSMLRLTQLQLRNHGWDKLKYPHLQVPWLSSEDSVWRDLECPILQICFSQKGNRGNPLLAVRSLKKISIFQPWHGQNFEAGNIGMDYLYSFSSSKTGDNLHIDMAFNPWFPQQIGIVDSNARWTVFEFASRQMATISKTWTASLHSKPLHRNRTPDDGWARIFWIHNIETVAVCTRTQLTLYNLAGDEPMNVKTIYFASITSTAWMLDALVPSNYPSKLCLLNSQHVLVYNFNDGSNGLAIDLQLKIRHFNNCDDLSLRLLCWSKEDNMSIVVRSSTFDSCSHYRVSLHDSPILFGRPTKFQIDASVSRGTPIREVHLRPIQLLKTSSRSKGRKKVVNHPAEDAQLYIVTVLHNDSTLVESVCYCFDESASQSKRTLEPPSWETQASKPIFTSNAIISGGDTFINDEVTLDSNDRALMPVEPSARRRRRSALPTTSGKRIVNLERITHQLGSSAADTQSIDNLAVEVRDTIISKYHDSIHFMPTLDDLYTGELVVGDIHAASTLLQQSFARKDPAHDDVPEMAEHGSRMEVASIPLPRFLNLDHELAGSTLSSIYDQLVSGWISSLPTQVPAWVRLAKVAIARSTAAELMLASRTLQLEEPPEEQQTQEQKPQPLTWSLPLRSFDAPPSSTSAALIPEAIALPTPSPTGTPSLTTSSSSPSTIHAQSLDRLKRYTTFEKAAPLELPRSLRNVLAHWNVGSNVEEYDWIEGSKKVSRQNEDEDDDMTVKDRRRARKHAERHLRRQRKEAAASQAQQLASSQANEIFSASQPPVLQVESSQPTAFAGSSQAQSQSQGIPASQILPGRFGGRPPKKKKRKVAGF